jgi:hypothetical protein
MSKTVNMRGRRGRIIAVLLVAVLGTTAAAWAYWSQPSKGSASGHVGSLGAPTITSAAGGGEVATISWSSVTAPGSGAVKYYVSRDGGAPKGNCATSASPSTVTSCTDSAVAPGSHSYTVTAVWRSWTAASAPKSATAISAPTVTAANPASLGQGAGAQTIAITGSHFVAGASTTISGTGVTVNSTTFQSSTELTVAVTVAVGAPTGARNVTVTNTDTGSGSGTGIFTVNAAPTVTSTNPSSRGQGSTNQSVTIKGTGFVNGAEATFSGTGITVNSTTFASSTELTANVSITASASTGARTVTVTNPDHGVGVRSSGFTVNAAPTVTSTSPSSRGQGATGTTIAIKGSNFVSGAEATFPGTGITVESTSFTNSTELKAKVSLEPGTSIGARAVTVTNPDGGVGSLAGGFTVNAAPTVTSTNPSVRVQGGSAANITVNGSGFVSGTGLAASFSGSGITVNSTTFKSSTEVVANVTVSVSATAGARTVTVKNPDEGAGSLAGGFTVDALPSIESISPTSGDKGGTQAVAIKGTGFASGASVTLGSNVKVSSVNVKSSTEITATVAVESSATAGTRTVTVTNLDGGSDTLEGAFTVNSAPTIESVSPSSRGQGASNQTITVKGKNFLSGTGLAVTFSGTGITVNSTSFVSSTVVTANVTIASNATAGSRNVTVTNPDTTSVTSSFAFAVTSAPTVTSTSPSSRGQGASKATVTIKGSGFASGVSSSFGSGITVESTTRNSSTELTATISIAAGTALGSRAVTVTNLDEGTGTLANAFTVTAAPSVESVSPGSRGQGASGQTLTIKGSGFVSGSGLAVSFSGTGITVNSTTFKSSTELTANVSVSSSAGTEARTLTVTNPDEGEVSLANAFTVNAGPNVGSVTPSAGDKGGTQAVAIKGTGFVSGASVTFGSGVNLSSVSVKSSTEITATLAVESSATAGTRTATVTNTDGGSDTLEGAFTVNSAPTIESVSPSSRGQGASNQTITVKGKNFLSGTGLAVTFSGTGITVNSTSFVNSTEVTANVSVAPGATTGSRNVTVTNPDTTAVTSTGAFSVNAPPTLTSTSPSSRGQGASSQTVAIKGSGFVSGAGLAASFSGTGVIVNSTTFKSSTELTANVTVETGASIGARSLTVTNGDGSTASLTNAFAVNSAPNLESLNPSSRGQGATSQTVTVKGSGFVSGTGLAVSFSGTGITVTSTTFKSSTEVAALITVESGASIGPRTVTVTNPDGGTDTLANGFTVNAAPTITSPFNSFGSRAKITHNTPGEFEVVGSGFVSGLTVSISGGFSNISTTFVNSSHLKVKATAGNGSQTGRYDLTVTNPDGGSATSKESVENA